MAKVNVCIPKDIAVKLRQQFKLKEQLTPNELRDKITTLIRKKHGVDLEIKDATKIVDLNSNLNKAKKELGDNIGSLDHEKQMIDYFKAENELNKFLKELAPSSDFAVATGTIGRGLMLASIKSPVLNVISNVENTITEKLVRRLSAGQFTKTNTDLAKKYVKMANKIYNETGVDISRMMDIGDLGIGGQRILGKDTVSAAGTGAIKKTGQFIEDKIFKQLMGKPDSITANINFIDSVLLNATKLAKNNSQQARTIAKDAMLLNPKSTAGKLVRQQAVLDAQVATYTQRTAMSGFSEGVRNILNKATGDARLGDWFMPFVKTPANVISTSADYAGLGIFKGLYDLGKGIKNGTLNNPQTIRNITTDLFRGGVGVTSAFAISQLFKPEDFVGAYDPKRSQIEQLKNSNYNAVKIGDKWVSVDYFGPLSIPLTAMMYAKKGEGYIQKSQKYATGILSGVSQLPGVDFLVDSAKELSKTLDSEFEGTGMDAVNSLVEQASSRLVPGIVIDIAKMTDPLQRKATETTLGPIVSKIPFARQTLPEKKNVFNESLKNESPLITILAGSRIKTNNNSPVVKELDRVTLALDKGSTFTDWSKTTGKEIGQFKEKIGEEKFEQAKTDYGKELQSELTKLFNNPKYNLMSDEEKLNQINSQDDQAKEKIFKQYGFKYKQEKTKKTKTY